MTYTVVATPCNPPKEVMSNIGYLTSTWARTLVLVGIMLMIRFLVNNLLLLLSQANQNIIQEGITSGESLFILCVAKRFTERSNQNENSNGYRKCFE